MKHRILLAVLVVSMLAMGSVAFAASTTGDLDVTANVVASCSISSTAEVAFGTYDPTSATPKDGAGSVTFKCTKDVGYEILITGTREMTGVGGTLPFELYSDAGRTTTWPSITPGVLGAAPSKDDITRDIYGQIPAGADVGVGAFTATVVVNLSY